MQNRIVEIASDGAHISLMRGFLTVAIDGAETGRVAIEDMAALIIRGHGASFSVNICARLAESNVPVVICGSKQSPDAVIWPVSGHFCQGLHMQAQAMARKPMRKRLWAQLVRGKIEAQALVLASFFLNSDDLVSMARRVRSGDAGNLEAQAARRYWKRLMGDDFRRGRYAGGVNGGLNYGYTVLRAACARSILAAGLHPSLSLHHQSRGDALRLADDLMEPYRPWVDYQVKRILENQPAGEFELEPETKSRIASVLQMDFSGPHGASPMQACIDRMAQSLVQVFAGETREMEMPGAPLPLSASAGVK